MQNTVGAQSTYIARSKLQLLFRDGKNTNGDDKDTVPSEKEIRNKRRPKGRYRRKNGDAKVVEDCKRDRCRNVFLQCIITTYVAHYQRHYIIL